MTAADPDVLQARLVAAASEAVGRTLALMPTVGKVGGFSHEALIVADRGTGERLLVRLAPTEGPFPPYDVVAEARLVERLGAVLPVPVVHGTGAAGAREFAVVGWLEGEVMLHGTDPRIAESGDAPDTWARRVVEALAAVHDRAAAAVCELPAPKGSHAQHILDRWERVLRGLSGVRASPVAWLALAWLRRHRPSQPETTLTHGDFRLGNLLWQGSAPVILDWEHAEVGDPLSDLAWLLMSAMDDQDMVMGLVTKRRLIELYEAESGREVDRERLAWWEVLGTFVRLCMENRLVEFEFQRERPDLRGLLWDAGSARTCVSLLSLMDRAGDGRRAVR